MTTSGTRRARAIGKSERAAAAEMRVDKTRPQCSQVGLRRQRAEMLEQSAVEARRECRSRRAAAARPRDRRARRRDAARPRPATDARTRHRAGAGNAPPIGARCDRDKPGSCAGPGSARFGPASANQRLVAGGDLVPAQPALARQRRRGESAAKSRRRAASGLPPPRTPRHRRRRSR